MAHFFRRFGIALAAFGGMGIVVLFFGAIAFSLHWCAAPLLGPRDTTYDTGREVYEGSGAFTDLIGISVPEGLELKACFTDPFWRETSHLFILRASSQEKLRESLAKLPLGRREKNSNRTWSFNNDGFNRLYPKDWAKMEPYGGNGTGSYWLEAVCDKDELTLYVAAYTF